MFSEFPPETVYSYPAPSVTGHLPALQCLKQAKLYESDSRTAIYIHVPFCLTICEFCSLLKTNKFRPEDVEQAVEFTLREMRMVADFFGIHGKRISAFYFGGGTASILSAAQVDLLLAEAHRLFNVLPEAELSFEGECLTLSKKDFLQSLASMGFQRLSYGVQVMDQGARQVLNLKPKVSALKQLAEDAGALFKDVCVDFIYGWPGQSLAQMESDLTALLTEIAPLSVEVFQFEKLEASPYFLQQLHAAGVRDLETRQFQEQRLRIGEIFRAHGFTEKTYTKFTTLEAHPATTYSDAFYGYDNGNVLGFGRGGQSFFNGAMWGNSQDSAGHYGCIEMGVLPLDAFASYRKCERESVTWPRRGWISASTVEEIDNPSFRNKMDALVEAGYVERKPDVLRLTEKGLIWVPSIMDYLLSKPQYEHYHRQSDARIRARSAPIIHHLKREYAGI